MACVNRHTILAVMHRMTATAPRHAFIVETIGNAAIHERYGKADGDEKKFTH
jgi:hypothetical protein